MAQNRSTVTVPVQSDWDWHKIFTHCSIPVEVFEHIYWLSLLAQSLYRFGISELRTRAAGITWLPERNSDTDVSIETESLVLYANTGQFIVLCQTEAHGE